MNKKACITGITGQDGSYLAESLISRGYEVVGLHRRNSTNNFGRINHLIDHKLFTLEEFDITDPSCVAQTVTQNDPDEFYNLAAQSHVGTSFKQPSTTFSINTSGVINILEAIRNYSPGIKFYQASTSELFGEKQKGVNSFNEKSLLLLLKSQVALNKIDEAKAIAINLCAKYPLPY